MPPPPGASPPPTQWAVPEPEPVAAPGLVYAGAGVRFVAYVIDVIVLLIAVVFLAVVVGIFLAFVLLAGGIEDTSGSTATAFSGAIIGLAIELVYFVGFWTSGGRGTPGMRLLKLQIGNSADGRNITAGQAVKRWVALGFPISALAVLPVLGNVAGLLLLVWQIILLISVATNPARQGIHDRFAETAIVRPAGASNAGAVVGCIVLVAIAFVGLFFLALIALIFLGGQIQTILSDPAFQN